MRLCLFFWLHPLELVLASELGFLRTWSLEQKLHQHQAIQWQTQIPWPYPDLWNQIFHGEGPMQGYRMCWATWAADLTHSYSECIPSSGALAYGCLHLECTCSWVTSAGVNIWSLSVYLLPFLTWWICKVNRNMASGLFDSFQNQVTIDHMPEYRRHLLPLTTHGNFTPPHR